MILNTPGKRVKQYILPTVCAAVLLVGTGLFARQTWRRTDAESLALTEQSLRRAAVQCYALEGAYPPSAEYLYTHYGVSPDLNRFVVYYTFVADNLMPDITVLPVNQ